MFLLTQILLGKLMSLHVRVPNLEEHVNATMVRLFSLYLECFKVTAHFFLFVFFVLFCFCFFVFLIGLKGS